MIKKICNVLLKLKLMQINDWLILLSLLKSRKCGIWKLNKWKCVDDNELMELGWKWQAGGEILW